MSEDITDSLIESDYFYKKKDYRKVDQILSRILVHNPDNAQANHQLGKLALKLQKYKLGLRFNRKAAESENDEYLFYYLENLFLLGEQAQFKIELAKSCILALINEKPLTLGSGIQKRLLECSKIPINQHFFTGDITLPTEIRQNKSIKSVVKKGNSFLDLRSEEQLEKIKRLLRQREILAAIEAAEQLLITDPENKEILNLLGTGFALRKEFTTAARYYHRIISLDAKNLDAHTNLAGVHIETGKYKKALSLLEIVVTSHPSYVYGYVLYARALTLIGSKDDALLQYYCALRLNMEDEKILFEIGKILQDLSYVPATEIVYQQCIANNKNNIDPYINLSSLYYSTENYDAALRVAKQAVTLKKNSFEANYNCAIAFDALSQLDAAESFYKEALSQNNQSIETFHKLGNLYFKQSKYDLAEKTYTQALIISPNHIEIINNLAACHFNLGVVDRAIYYFERVLEIKPDFEIALENLQTILVQTQTPLLKKYKSIFVGNTLAMSKKPKMYINSAISALIQGNQKEASRLINLYKNASSDVKRKLHPKDLTFCNAYLKFITAMLSEDTDYQRKRGDAETIFHFGDSHCLTFSNQLVQTFEGLRKIIPRITFGAKAYHFSQKGDNQFKAITEHNLSQVRPRSSVLLSFGEIDCRTDEGILPASKFDSHRATQLINETVQGYVDWFNVVANKSDLHLKFLNVYSPVPSKDATDELNLLRENAIKHFNASLMEALHKTQHDLIDMHAYTDDRTGKSNNELHIDEFHLGFRALQALEAELKK